MSSKLNLVNLLQQQLFSNFSHSIYLFVQYNMHIIILQRSNVVLHPNFCQLTNFQLLLLNQSKNQSIKLISVYLNSLFFQIRILIRTMIQSLQNKSQTLNDDCLFFKYFTLIIQYLNHLRAFLLFLMFFENDTLSVIVRFLKVIQKYLFQCFIRHDSPTINQFVLKNFQKNMLEDKLDQNTKIILCQIVKHIVKKQRLCKRQNIKLYLNILQKLETIEAKQEVVKILTFSIKFYQETLTNSEINQLNKLIFFNQQIQLRLKQDLNMQVQQNKNRSEQLNFNQMSHNQVISNINRQNIIISKNYQRSQYKKQIKDSHQTQLTSQNFFKTVAKENKGLIQAKNVQFIPIQQDGSNKYWLHTTYAQVKKFYLNAKRKEKIYLEDKKYLIQKLKGTKFFTSGLKDIIKMKSLFGQFITCRMIIKTFHLISDENLDKGIIESLFEYICPLTDLKKTFCGYEQSQFNKVCDKMVCSYIFNKKYGDEPDLVKQFANKIYDKGLTIQRSWYWDSYTIKYQQTKKIIQQQIITMRNQIAETIFKYYKKNPQNLSQSQIKKINEVLQQTEQNRIFKTFLIKMLYLGDSSKLDKNLFQRSLQCLKLGNNNTQEALAYLNSQLMNQQNCKQLFDQKIIHNIAELLQNQLVVNSTKISLCLLINNWLRHDFSTPLKQITLNILEKLLQKDTNQILLEEILVGIYLHAKKIKFLFNSTIFSLNKKYLNLSQKLQNYIIMILKEVPGNIQIQCFIQMISSKFNDLKAIILNFESKVQFLEINNANDEKNLLGNYVGSIFVNQLQKKVQVSQKCISYIINSLHSQSIQIRIKSSKCLFLISRQQCKNFALSTLSNLKQMLNNQIVDIQVYCTLAYTKILRYFLQNNFTKELNQYCQVLQKIYCFSKVQLNQINYSKEINETIVKILILVNKRLIISQQQFKIIDFILSDEDQKYQRKTQILQILICSSRHLKIPKNILNLLENLYESNKNFRQNCIKVFCNAIMNGQVVQKSILQYFIDILYESSQKKQLKNAYEVLNQANANLNQDIPDQFFSVLDIEKAVLSINSNRKDKKKAFNHLMKQVSNGIYLTKNAFQCLGLAFDQNELKILEVLINVSKYKQLIPLNVLQKIANKYDYQSEDHILELYQSFFNQIIQANQQLPECFIQKILQTKPSERTILMFVTMVNKNFTISYQIIRFLCHYFLTVQSKNQIIFTSLLKSFVLIVHQLPQKDESHQRFQIQKLLIQVVIQGIFKKNQNVFQSLTTCLLQKLIKNNTILSEKQIQKLKDSAEYCPTLTLIPSFISIFKKIKIDNTQHLFMKYMGMIQLENSQFLEFLIKNPRQLNLTQLLIRKKINECFKSISFQNWIKLVQLIIQSQYRFKVGQEILLSIGDAIHRLQQEQQRMWDTFCQLIRQNSPISDQMLILIEKIDYTRVKNKVKKHFIGSNTTTKVKVENQLQKLQTQYSVLSKQYINEDQFKNLKFSTLQIKFQKIDKFQIKQTQMLSQILTYIVYHQPKQSNIPKRSNNQQKIRLAIEFLQQKIIKKHYNGKVLIYYGYLVSKIKTTKIQEIKLFLLQNMEQICLNFFKQFLYCLKIISLEGQLQLSEKCLLTIFNMLRISSLDNQIKKEAYCILNNNQNNILPEFITWKQKDKKSILRQLQITDSQQIDTLQQILISSKNIYKKSKNIEVIIHEQLKMNLIDQYCTNDQERIRIRKCMIEKEEISRFSQKELNNIYRILGCRDGLVYLKIYSLQQIYKILLYIKHSNINYQTVIKIISYPKYLQVNLCNEWIRDLILKKLQKQQDLKSITSQHNNELLEQIRTKFTQNQIAKIMRSIIKIKDLRKEFKPFITFAINMKNKLVQIKKYEQFSVIIPNQKYQIQNLKKIIEIEMLLKYFSKTIAQTLQLKQIFSGLLKIGWNFQNLSKICSFSIIKMKKNIVMQIQNKIIDVLEVILNFNLNVSKFQKIQIILKDSPQLWLKQVKTLALQYRFKNTISKNISQVVEELKNHNASNNFITKQLQQNNFIQKIVSNINETREKIKNCNKKDTKILKNWVSQIKQTRKQPNSLMFNNQNLILQGIIMVQKGYGIIKGSQNFKMSHIQILSCFLYCKANQIETNGLLQQISTGQGKSLITACSALLFALFSNKPIDIFTSKAELAQRDHKQFKDLFQMFGLTSGCNSKTKNYIKGVKPCYKCNIVYGQISQFMFDTLRHQFFQLQTLGNRKNSIPFIDEADSTLLDDISNIIRISSISPGKDLLQPIYHLIWDRMLKLRKMHLQIQGKLYFFYGQIDVDQIRGKTKLTYFDSQNQRKVISDLERYVNVKKNISQIGQIVEQSLEKSLQTKLIAYCKQILQKKQNLKIPQCFIELVNIQIPFWVNNAINASIFYNQKFEYIIKQKQIQPVNDNNGCAQAFTNWGNGLHQFLQLKHNLKMTSQSFTTNFLSNVGFLKRYEKIYGLTGTLGNKLTQQMMKKIYNLDSILIPNQNVKQLVEYPKIIIPTYKKWMEKICNSAILECKRKRGCLIICQNIHMSDQLKKMLAKKYPLDKIKYYVINDEGQQKHIQKIKPGQIIISTILAGRGTDINAETLQQFGGMHVILTYQPLNQRKKMQVFGRTSRKGKKGSCQQIFRSCKQNINIQTQKNIQQVSSQQNQFLIQLKQFYQTKMQILLKKDNLFKKFCLKYSQLKKDFPQKMYMNQNESYYSLLQFQDKWALFLIKLDIGIISIQDSENQYEKLQTKLKEEAQNKSLIKNPYYLLRMAQNMIQSQQQKAQKYLQKAKQIDENIPAVYQSLAYLKLKKSNNKHKKKQIEELFLKAQCLFGQQLSFINTLLLLLQERSKTLDNQLGKQLTIKKSILIKFCQNIHNCLDITRRSRRCVNIMGTQKVKNNQTKNDNDSFHSLTSYNVVEEKIHLIDKIKGFSKSQINIEQIQKMDSYDIIFNDLIQTNQGDQAQLIVKNIKSQLLKHGEKNLKITSNYFNIEALKKIVSPNYIIQNASSQTILQKIKNKCGYMSKFKNFFSENKNIKLERYNQNSTEVQFERISALKLEKQMNKATNKSNLYKVTFLNFNTQFVKFNKILQEGGRLNLKFCSVKNPIQKVQNLDCSWFNLELFHADFSDIHARQVISLQIDKINKQRLRRQQRTIDFIVLKDINQQKESKIQLTEIKQDVFVLEKSNYSLAIQKLSRQEAKQILRNLLPKQFIFNLQCIALKLRKEDTQDYSLIDFVEENEEVNLVIDNLKESTSKGIIQLFREQNLQFSVCLSNINRKELTQIFKSANVDHQNLQYKKKLIKDSSYLKNASELEQLQQRGFQFLLDINERGFIPWKKIILVSALAVTQIAAGGLIMTFTAGLGAQLGLGLIVQGTFDVITIYQAFSKRRFSWSDYVKQKAISLMISLTTAGFTSIKNAAKGLKNNKMLNNVIKEGCENIITNPTLIKSTSLQIVESTVSNTLNSSKQALNSLALKCVGVKLAQACGRQILNNGAQFLANKLLNSLKPKIYETVLSNLKQKFQQQKFKRCINRFYSIKKVCSSTQKQRIQSQILRIVSQTLNPNQWTLQSQVNSVIGPIFKGILSQKIQYVSLALRAFTILQGSRHLYNITDIVSKTLLKKLSRMNKQNYSLSLLIQNQILKNKQLSKKLCLQLKENKIIFHLEDQQNQDHFVQIINPHAFKFKTINKEIKYEKPIKKYSELLIKNDLESNHQKIQTFLQNIYKNQQGEIGPNTQNNLFLDQLLDSIAQKITQNMIQTAESQIFMPVSSLAVGWAVNEISQTIQHQFLINQNENSIQQKKNQQQLKLLKDKVQNGQQLTKQQSQRFNQLKSYRNTFVSQARENAKDLDKNFNSLVIISEIENKFSPDKDQNYSDKGPSKQLIQYAEKISQKQQPAGLLQTSILNNTIPNNKPKSVQVSQQDFKNPQVQKVIKQKYQNQTVIINITRQNQNKVCVVGHSVLLENNKIFDPSEGKNLGENNCTYAIYLHLEGKQINQQNVKISRQNVANLALKNAKFVQKSLQAQRWVEENYPRQSSNILFKAGCTNCHKTKVGNLINNQSRWKDKYYKVNQTLWSKVQRFLVKSLPYVGAIGGLLKIGYDFIRQGALNAIAATVTVVSTFALWFLWFGNIFKNHQQQKTKKAIDQLNKIVKQSVDNQKQKQILLEIQKLLQKELESYSKNEQKQYNANQNAPHPICINLIQMINNVKEFINNKNQDLSLNQNLQKILNQNDSISPQIKQRINQCLSNIQIQIKTVMTMPKFVQNGNKVVNNLYGETVMKQFSPKNSTMLMLHNNQTQKTIDLKQLQEQNTGKDINSILQNYFNVSYHKNQQIWKTTDQILKKQFKQCQNDKKLMVKKYQSIPKQSDNKDNNSQICNQNKKK